jgi:hypothetical protein
MVPCPAGVGQAVGPGAARDRGRRVPRLLPRILPVPDTAQPVFLPGPAFPRVSTLRRPPIGSYARLSEADPLARMLILWSRPRRKP